DPDAYDRTVSADDETLIRAAIADHLPAANGRLIAAKTCLYTMTPDGHFLIDRLADAPQVIVASPCSGPGFKFAPVVGEILAELATAGTTRPDISRFRRDRFGRPRAPPNASCGAATPPIEVARPPRAGNLWHQGRTEGNAMLGLMQDWPLLCHRVIDHAATNHAERPIVTRSVEGPM